MFCLAASSCWGSINMNTSYNNCYWLAFQALCATGCTVIVTCSDLYKGVCLQPLNEWIFKMKIKVLRVLVWTCFRALCSLNEEICVNWGGNLNKPVDADRSSKHHAHCVDCLPELCVIVGRLVSSQIAYGKLCTHRNQQTQNLTVIAELPAAICFLYLYLAPQILNLF